MSDTWVQVPVPDVIDTRDPSAITVGAAGVIFNQPGRYEITQVYKFTQPGGTVPLVLGSATGSATVAPTGTGGTRWAGSGATDAYGTVHYSVHVTAGAELYLWMLAAGVTQGAFHAEIFLSYTGPA